MQFLCFIVALIFKLVESVGNDSRQACENEIIVIDCTDGGLLLEKASISIQSVRYGEQAFRCGSMANGSCIHYDRMGVDDFCKNKTTCSFNVTNAVIGSSCGGRGFASLDIYHTCVYYGKWTDWESWTDCSRTCSGGYQHRTRTCNKQVLTANIVQCPGNDTEYRRCNIDACSYAGSTCRNDYFQPVCNSYNTKGRMQISGSNWREGCSWNYNTNNPYYDVTSTMETSCNNRSSCSVYVNDSTMGNCYTDYYYTASNTYTTYYYYTYYYYCNDWWGWYYSTCSGTTLGSNTETSYYAARYTSICGVFYWNYTCILPQWSLWSSWTDCSVTCDVGIKSRTRLCENEYNTSDGYSLKCEGEATETADCNIKWCSECKNRGFGYQSSDTLTMQNETKDTAYIFGDNKDMVHCCGVIMKWEFFPVKDGMLQFIVWRKRSFLSSYTVVGINSINITRNDAGNAMAFIVPINERLTIVANDIIGWYDSGLNILKYDLCDDFTNSSYSCPVKTKLTSLNGIAVDAIFDWDDIASVKLISNRVYAVHYTTVENLPPAFNITTKAIIPDHAAVDSSVMDFYFSDNNDWMTSYHVVDNDWFYFDTHKETIHVKTQLPHEVGFSRHVYTVVITAEDSCLNSVTGTVTITTTNGPVEFRNLPATVNMSANKTGLTELFKILTYDPSFPKDSISCKVLVEYPEITDTEFSIIMNSTITDNNDSTEWLVYVNASGRLNDDYFQLKIMCSDGTDLSNQMLHVNVTNAVPVPVSKTVSFKACENEMIVIDCNDAGLIYEKASIVIESVRYNEQSFRCGSETDGTCLHYDKFCVEDFCKNKTKCSFNVSNAVIGSACGGSGFASLEINYTCAYYSKWSGWASWTDCSRTCSGGYQSRKRRCYMHTQVVTANILQCPGNDTEYRRCNTDACTYAGSTCRNDYFQPVCNSYNTKGRMQISSSNWREGCSWNYNTNNPYYDVTSTLETSCNNRSSCSVYVNDSTLGNCYTDYYYTASNTYTTYYYYTYYYYCNDWWGWYYYSSCSGTTLGSNTETSYYAARYTSICGVFYWNYTCILPQWSLWSPWTDCSVTCDAGIKSRTRHCEDEYSTLDGYSLKCEGEATETADCNDKWCSECKNRGFGYQSSDTLTMQNETKVTAYIFGDQKDIVHCCGLIMKWEFFPVKEGILQFVVWRQKSFLSSYTVVGTNSINVTRNDTGHAMTYIVPIKERLTIVTNDIIGWYDSGLNILKYDLCNDFANSSYRCPVKTKLTSLNGITVDAIFDWDDIASVKLISNRVYAVHYTTVENPPPAFNITTKANIPDHAATDSSVMDFYFTDNNDWMTSYHVVDNDWFYFDTLKETIHVKTQLPHEVGFSRHVYTVVITAEDSCLNSVTGTATITTTNGPVEFRNLPAAVNLSANKTGITELFKILTYDPSVPKDNVSCKVLVEYPEITDTEFSIIMNSTITDNTDTTEWLIYVNESGRSNEDYFLLKITCSDGTDLSTQELHVNVTNAVPVSTTVSLTACENEKIVIDCNDDGLIYEKTSIVIESLRYSAQAFKCGSLTDGTCLHYDRFIVDDFCKNKTKCSFNVSNAVIGSSCGGSGFAFLEINHTCVYYGKWSDWASWTDCSRTCSGGYQYRKRRCYMHTQVLTENITKCPGNDTEYRRCNTDACTYAGSTCRNDYFQPVCDSYKTKGRMQVSSSNWREGCSWNYNTNNPYYDVTSTMETSCNNRSSCSVYVNDSTLGNCYTDYYYTASNTYTTYYYYTYYYNCYDNWWGWYYSTCTGTTLGSMTGTTYYVARYTSICGVLYWNYTCILPQWSLWSPWTDCSVTCDVGIKSRKRLCENEYNTLDGYSLKCEGEATETENCNNKWCSECKNRGFGYQSSDTLTMQNETKDTAYIFGDQNDIVHCCGVIMKWEFFPVKEGMLQFVLWRKTSFLSSYTVVGINNINVSRNDTGNVMSYIVPINQRLTIVENDIIGWYDSGFNIIKYDLCNDFSNSSYRCPVKTKLTSLNGITVDAIFDWDDIASVKLISNRVYAVHYTTVENSPPAFNITTIATIPDHAAVDSSVMDFYFTDTNDWMTSYHVVDNDWFYFDTHKETIHVKTQLPHEVGFSRHVYTVVITAEDSCLNSVTGTVTITTTNGPVEFRNLPATANMPGNKTGSTELYKILTYDPSFPKDSVSCEVLVEYPEITDTEFSIMMNSTLIDNSDVTEWLVYVNATGPSNEDYFQLKIMCSDGTDLSNQMLHINVTDAIPVSKTVSIQACENEKIVFDCNEEGLIYENASIVIESIRYSEQAFRCGSVTDGICLHYDKFSVEDFCKTKSKCSFNVTNAVIGSSCGGSGFTSLEINYTCIYYGKWSDWASWTDCSRTCSGGYQYRKRRCYNQVLTSNILQCPGNDTEYRRCNTDACTYAGSTCRNDYFQPVCNAYNTEGRMQISSSNWREGCSWNYNTNNPYYDVTSTMETSCNNRSSCFVYVNDSTLGNCYTDYYYTASNTYTTYYYYTYYYNCYDNWWGWYYSSCTGTALGSMTGTTYYVARYTSICGVLYWNYTCILPQWSLWSPWTECSVTCDVGIKLRTRLCENEYNTLDGYSLKCEGEATETADCNDKWCSECKNRGFGYKSADKLTMQNETKDTAYVFGDNKDMVHCCGQIMNWEFFPVKEGMLQFILWRQKSLLPSYTVVGINSIKITRNDTGNVMSYIVPINQRLTIVANDIIGWYDSGLNILKYDLCNNFTNSSYSCPVKTKLTSLNGITVDTIFDWNDKASVKLISNRVYALQYTTEENPPPAFNITTKATIPDHAAVDSSVMDFYFTDNNDFMTSYHIIVNDWFYFDTHKETIHVKTQLPHEVGFSRHVYTVVITAEDSCLNSVTGTVTITTTNGPVEFKNLPATAKMSGNETGIQEIFKIFTYDPSFPKDNISCGVIVSYPNITGTEFTIRANGTITDLTEWLVYVNASGRSTDEEYFMLKIMCSDGTDLSNEVLHVNFTSDILVSTSVAVPFSTTVTPPVSSTDGVLPSTKVAVLVSTTIDGVLASTKVAIPVSSTDAVLISPTASAPVPSTGTAPVLLTVEIPVSSTDTVSISPTATAPVPSTGSVSVSTAATASVQSTDSVLASTKGSISILTTGGVSVPTKVGVSVSTTVAIPVSSTYALPVSSKDDNKVVVPVVVTVVALASIGAAVGIKLAVRKLKSMQKIHPSPDNNVREQQSEEMDM